MDRHFFNLRRTTVLIFVVSLVTLYIGCGGGGGGSSSNTNADSEQYADVSGTWHITETITQTSCSDYSGDEYDVTVVQSGKNITVTDDNGNQYSGSVSGNTLSWTGSFSKDDGTVTINAMSLTISNNTLGGTASWTWSNGSHSCSGKTQVNGTKANGDNSTSTGFTGTWKFIEYDDPDTCGGGATTDTFTTTITTSGSQITVINPDGNLITGTISGKKATLHQVASEENGTGTSTTDVTLTLSSDGTIITGSGSWSEVYPTHHTDDCSGTFTMIGTRK